MSWAIIILGLAVLIGVFVIYARYMELEDDDDDTTVYMDDSVYASEWWWGPLPWYVGDWDGWRGGRGGGRWGPTHHYRRPYRGDSGHHRPGGGSIAPRPGGGSIAPRPGGGRIRGGGGGRGGRR